MDRSFFYQYCRCLHFCLTFFLSFFFVVFCLFIKRLIFSQCKLANGVHTGSETGRIYVRPMANTPKTVITKTWKEKRNTNMHTNTSKATDTRVFRMPDKRADSSKNTILSLHMGFSKYILLMRTSSMIFGAVHFVSFQFFFFSLCLFVSILSLLLTLLLLYMSLDERVALSFNLCILVLILDFRIFRLKLKFQ